jgi:hypothetical protein
MKTKLHILEWRRRERSDTWHFVSTCRWWPAIFATKYLTVTKKPKHGEFCNECIAKSKRG